MPKLNNGGANAIKGFNYQKSVIILIAILHYLNDYDFSIQVETEDDIVVTIDNVKTYIQVKSESLGVGPITRRPESKDSIIEKNLARDDDTGHFKIVSPSFSYLNTHLVEVEAVVMTDGAEVYTFSKDALKDIKKKLPGISPEKLNRSRVAVTSFKPNHKAAMDNLIGIMARKGIPVDNSYGMASLKEFCHQIDQRSEKNVLDEKDFEKKMFTKNDLHTIFRHSHRAQHYEDIVKKLNYTLMKQIELKKRNGTVEAIYTTYVNIAKQSIEKMDLMEMNERQVMEEAMGSISFNPGVDALDQEAVVISAYSQVLFERSQV